ncbi:MAG: hypothetical protein F6K41_08635 [Symploca sp. SIO3E6]|nr:hypothetical protein [Caldora sp. SIO3E6]
MQFFFTKKANPSSIPTYRATTVAPQEPPVTDTLSPEPLLPQPTLPIWVLNQDIYKKGSQAISRGGEGEIWQTNRPEYLLKIYHESTPERVKKLESMVVSHPSKPEVYRHHLPWAWPEYLLEDQQGERIGFVMPFIRKSQKLPEVYIPKSRKILNFESEWQVNWKFLHITAKNLAHLIYSLHDQGYVIGDLKPENIVVNQDALPSIIDTDSFQVTNPQTKSIYPCLVGSEGFTPPELLEKNLADIEQLPQQDDFRLAVIIHHLLLERHPFTGYLQDSEEPPETDELVRQGLWHYAAEGPEKMEQPGKRFIPLEIVHPQLQKLFLQCFNDGHCNPQARPTALEWLNALDLAINDLAHCDQFNTHWYSKHYHKCYWCERKEKLTLDIFDNSPQYQQLYKLLAAQNWKQADLETKYLLLKIAGRINEGWLDKPALENLPTEVIEIIDQLWLNHSAEHFGFSTQKRIYLETGNKLGEINWEAYNDFGTVVGWREGKIWKNYLDLEFSLNAPEGHLPFCCAGFDVCVVAFLALRL